MEDENYMENIKTMKLYGSTKSKITKDETGENVLHLEIIEMVLIMIINKVQ